MALQPRTGIETSRAWDRTLVVLYVVTGGCLVETNPSFVSDASETSVADSSEGTTIEASSSSSDASTSGIASTSSQDASSGSESSTGEEVPVLDATIVDLGPASLEPAPQIAWSGSTLGVSWDVHGQFVRLGEDGSTIGLTEVPLDSAEKKSPGLGATDDRFYAIYADYNGQAYLLARQTTDTWVSLGRMDAAEDTLSPAVDRWRTGLVMAWREDVLNLRITALDGAGLITTSDVLEIGSSHRSERFLDTSDGLTTLITSDNGERQLLHHDSDLVYRGLAFLNDGPADVVWEPDTSTFTFVAARAGDLVRGTFDGELIQGELEVLVEDGGTIHDVTIHGDDGRYLIAWRATADGGTSVLQVGRLDENQAFETLVLDQDTGGVTRVIDNGSVAAIGWVGADGPRVGLVQW